MELGLSELREKLKQLSDELKKAKAAIASGTRPENPGRIKEMRRTIARIKTIIKQKGGN